MKIFKVSPLDSGIWNRLELERFLVENQGQDIKLMLQDEGCSCVEIGLYDLLDLYNFKSVVIDSSNIFEQHPVYKTTLSPGAFKFFDLPTTTDYGQFHQWNQSKIFGIFYNRPIWHRLGLLAHMYEYHRPQTLFNFRHDPGCVDQRKLFELTELFTHHPESAANFLKHYRDFPLRLENHDGYTKIATTKQHVDQLCNFYENFLIDIVAETFVKGLTFFATEKTVRPFLLKKPFIAMASRDHLLYLRQMGFKTFYQYWDEDYDGFSEVDRYLKIINLLDHLSNKSTRELSEMYKDMQSILDHNYHLIISGKFSTNLKIAT
jgi:hypothetical protein